MSQLKWLMPNLPPMPTRANPVTASNLIHFKVEIVNNSGNCSLVHCLHGFTKKETLMGDEMYQCQHCKKKVEAEKQLTFTRLPKVLALQLKRFGFDFSSTSASKISYHVHFEDHAHIAIGNPDSHVEPSSNLHLHLHPDRNPNPNPDHNLTLNLIPTLTLTPSLTQIVEELGHVTVCHRPACSAWRIYFIRSTCSRR